MCLNESEPSGTVRLEVVELEKDHGFKGQLFRATGSVCKEMKRQV